MASAWARLDLQNSEPETFRIKSARPIQESVRFRIPFDTLFQFARVLRKFARVLRKFAPVLRAPAGPNWPLNRSQFEKSPFN